MPLFVDCPDAWDKSAVGAGEAACGLNSEEAEDVSAEGVGDSTGVVEGELSGAGELSGVDTPGVSEEVLAGFDAEAAGVAEETERTNGISRF